MGEAEKTTSNRRHSLYHSEILKTRLYDKTFLYRSYGLTTNREAEKTISNRIPSLYKPQILKTRLYDKPFLNRGHCLTTNTEVVKIISNRRYSLYQPKIFKTRLCDKQFWNRRYCLTTNGEAERTTSNRRHSLYHSSILKTRLYDKTCLDRSYGLTTNREAEKTISNRISSLYKPQILKTRLYDKQPFLNKGHCLTTNTEAVKIISNRGYFFFSLARLFRCRSARWDWVPWPPLRGSGQLAWGSRVGQIEDIGQGRASISCGLPRVAPAVAPKRSGVLDRHAQHPPPASQPAAAGGGSHRRGNAARAMVNQEAQEFAALPAAATTELGGEDQSAARLVGAAPGTPAVFAGAPRWWQPRHCPLLGGWARHLGWGRRRGWRRSIAPHQVVWRRRWRGRAVVGQCWRHLAGWGTQSIAVGRRGRRRLRLRAQSAPRHARRVARVGPRRPSGGRQARGRRTGLGARHSHALGRRRRRWRRWLGEVSVAGAGGRCSWPGGGSVVPGSDGTARSHAPAPGPAWERRRARWLGGKEGNTHSCRW